MIAVPAIAPPAEFEDVLTAAVSDLNITLRTAPTMSNREFEETVLRAMLAAATSTRFNGQIVKTDDMAFPDITAAEYYGVEVKKTSKAAFKTAGNSIFEQARVPGVEAIYIIMGNHETARWKPYQEAIDNIVVTHSPRYGINLDCTATVFDRMGITYEVFRHLSQTEKMECVKSLYSDSKLWWLSTMANGADYRFWAGLSGQQKDALLTETMIVCPEMFGGSRTKFQGVSVYAMGQGVIIPNVRDMFTAGGRVRIAGKDYPQIYGRLEALLPDIDRAMPQIDTETLASFWGISPASNINHRQQQWRDLVAGASRYDLQTILG